MKAAALLGVLVALPLTWLAGEQHRRNCEQADRVSCSVLPWDNGQVVKSNGIPPLVLR